MRSNVFMIGVGLLVSGCTGTSSAPDPGPIQMVLPLDFEIEGATRIAQNETEALFRWTGTAPVGSRATGASSGDPELRASLPPGLPLHVVFRLEYVLRPEVALGFRVTDEKHGERCVDTRAGYNVGGRFVATCGTVIPADDKARAWRIAVRPEFNADPEIRFTMDVLVALHKPRPLATFLGVATVIDPRGGAGEPSLAVAPDGTLYTTGLDGRFDFLTESGGVYRSVDDGRTWTHQGAPTAPFPNQDPDLAVDVDGVVWFNTLNEGCMVSAVSHDRGTTWSTNPLSCGAPHLDRQYVVPTSGGEAYMFGKGRPGLYQVAAKTIDYGRTWIPLGPVEGIEPHLRDVNYGTGPAGGGFWNKATGSIFLAYGLAFDGPASTATAPFAPGYSVTRNGGLTWETRQLPFMEGRPIGYTVGAADEAGNVYLAWMEQFGEGEDADVALFLVASKDDGRTWGARLRVDSTRWSKVFPTLVTGAQGEVAIGYYEADRLGFPGTAHNETLWRVTLAWTHDALANQPSFQYGTLSNGSVKQGPLCPRINGGCNGGAEFLDYFHIKRLTDGRIGSAHNSMLTAEERLVVVYTATAEPLLSSWHQERPANA